MNSDAVKSRSPICKGLRALCAKYEIKITPASLPLDLLNEMAKKSYSAFLSEDLPTIRPILRRELLGMALVEDGESVFEGTFDGYGDSGDISISTDIPAVETFLIGMIEQHAQFDWYNNDGGGGDITWDIRTDKVVINGYQNETVAHDVMNEVEF